MDHLSPLQKLRATAPDIGGRAPTSRIHGDAYRGLFPTEWRIPAGTDYWWVVQSAGTSRSGVPCRNSATDESCACRFPVPPPPPTMAAVGGFLALRGIIAHTASGGCKETDDPSPSEFRNNSGDHACRQHDQGALHQTSPTSSQVASLKLPSARTNGWPGGPTGSPGMKLNPVKATSNVPSKKPDLVR